MVPREMMDAAHVAAVMVRVHGPDPKGKKMRRHAFYHSESGDTTLSASGLLLPDGLNFCNSSSERKNMSVSLMVITCASIVEPFLLDELSGTSKPECRESPKLIPGAEVDILTEAVEQLNGNSFQDMDRSPCWLPANLVALVDVPSAGAALQALLDAHGGSVDGSWEVGWALAPAESSSQLRGLNTQALAKSQILKESITSELSQNGQMMAVVDGLRAGGSLAMATTRVAVLSLSCERVKMISRLVLAEPRKRGDFLLVVGSPFGTLSPLHFFNSMSVGIVSNCWPPASSRVSLLMADVRCLPGMEGAPVFDRYGEFVGLLARPLRQRGGGAEVQLVITSEALASALQGVGINLQATFEMGEFKIPFLNSTQGKELNTVCHGSRASCWDKCSASGGPLSMPALDQAVASIVLVTVGDGAWASGIILNNMGLILTNAHLLEPWRFGKTLPSHGERELTGLKIATNTKDNPSVCTIVETEVHDSEFRAGSKQNLNHIELLNPSSIKTTFRMDELVKNDGDFGVTTCPALEFNYRSYRRIRVRLDHLRPRSWYDARAIYVSRGPLDIALLQLDPVPPGLLPIIPEEDCPLPGSMAVVIGHGLFGPRSDLYPSISAGVVARVVKAGKLTQETAKETGECPAMLETTAAVHPGGSGGAVVSARGRMIGLVTSNARHSGGTVIPHLNFSIPCAALKPIFSFASGEMEDLSQLSAIEKPNESLSAVWALVPPTPPKPSPLLPFLSPKQRDAEGGSDVSKSQHSQQKGSRFAKFITEKGMDFSMQQHQPLLRSEEQGPRRWPLDKELPATSVPGQAFHSRM